MTRVAVVIASLGRRDILAALVDRLRGQTRPPEAICIAVSKQEDARAYSEAEGIEVLVSPIGSCAQRNRGIERVLPDADIIAFLDDDFVPASNYFERLVEFFAERPAAAGVTGVVVADGVTGPGLSMDEAIAAIAAQAPVSPENPEMLEERVSLYGCNMAFRREAIENVRFDERLPLYGWLED
ncbi:MAG: glycosyltransferase family 2 protein, partial [Pseudomonadota bacterium]